MTLHILHLEDDPADRDLIRTTLTAAGFECRIVSAANEAQFRDGLANPDLDLILSDFTLPGYDGTSALVLAQSLCPDVPFLFISGTIGEERAVDSLINGATDYVLKDHLVRLPPAVRRALGERNARDQRRATEQALRQSEQRFREMAATIRDVFWSASPDGSKRHYLSPAAEQVWGRPLADLTARPALWLEAIAPAERRQVDRALAQLAEGTEFRLTYPIVRPDGSVRWIEDRGYPVFGPTGTVERTVGVATDITDRRQLEAKLQQAQKMEAIGQLAGGIAHDFNNNLTVIMGHANLMLDANGLSTKQTAHLQQIYSAGNRAASLTRQLLVFGRNQITELQPIDLNTTITDTVQLLDRLIGENIRLDFSPSDSLPLVAADSAMMEQVLINLAVNARDAMPHGGNLTIATTYLTLDAAAVRDHTGGRPGTFACIRVTDTGTGIAPEIISRIFDPFFTTKEFGRGTGIGLAAVFGTVKQHNGWVAVESTVGHGTSFRVFLPPAPPDAQAKPRPRLQTAVSGGRETILLVEDDASVREFTTAVLQNLGYRVLQASSSVQALDTWRWHADRIALLLTDMVMPDDLSGLELATRLIAEKPSLQVVCMSGYTAEMLTQFPAPPGVRFLPKPFQPQILARTIREILDQPHSTT